MKTVFRAMRETDNVTQFTISEHFWAGSPSWNTLARRKSLESLNWRS
jgi:hypothetical protein